MEIGVAEDGGPIAAEAKLVRPGAAKGGVGAGGGGAVAGAGRGRDGGGYAPPQVCVPPQHRVEGRAAAGLVALGL